MKKKEALGKFRLSIGNYKILTLDYFDRKY